VCVCVCVAVAVLVAVAVAVAVAVVDAGEDVGVEDGGVAFVGVALLVLVLVLVLVVADDASEGSAAEGVLSTDGDGCGSPWSKADGDEASVLRAVVTPLEALKEVADLEEEEREDGSPSLECSSPIAGTVFSFASSWLLSTE